MYCGIIRPAAVESVDGELLIMKAGGLTIDLNFDFSTTLGRLVSLIPMLFKGQKYLVKFEWCWATFNTFIHDKNIDQPYSQYCSHWDR